MGEGLAAIDGVKRARRRATMDALAACTRGQPLHLVGCRQYAREAFAGVKAWPSPTMTPRAWQWGAGDQ